MSSPVIAMQQHHQLEDDGGGGVTSKPSAAASSLGSIIIQFPSTSANQTQNNQAADHLHQHNRANISNPYHQQAYLTDAGSVQTGGAVTQWTTAANTRDITTAATLQARPNETTYSSCHHQAATRDLMLQHQQNHRHKYWRRNYGGSRAAGPNRLLAPDRHRQQHVGAPDGSMPNSGAEHRNQPNGLAILNITTTTTMTSSTSSSRNEIDNISDDSMPPPPNYHEIPGIVPSYHGRTSGPPPAYDDVVNPNAPPPSYHSLFGQVREARKSSNGLVDLLRQLFLVLIGTIGCTMIIGFLLLIPITMIFVGVFYINECRAENIPSFLVVGGFVWIIKNMLNCYNQFRKDSSTVNRPPPRRAAHLSVVGSTTAPIEVVASQHPQEATSSDATPAAPTTTTSTHADAEQASTSTSTSTRTTTTAAVATTRPGITRTGHSNNANNNNNSHQHGHVRHPQMIGLTSDKCESILNYFLVVWFLAGCIVVYRIYEPDYDNPLSLSYCNRTVYLYAFWLMTSAFIIMAIVLSCLCCLMASSLVSCNQGR